MPSRKTAVTGPATRLAAVPADPHLGLTDEETQDAILPKVSRTFALTIPELPEDLRAVVANAYLLCRIADTIEDDPEMPLDEKTAFQRRFAELVAGEDDVRDFAFDLQLRMSRETAPDYVELVAKAPRILRVTRALNPRQRGALARCLRIMCDGMARFQPDERSRGLADVAELHEYCYYVAGVVGEMLTELFCDHSPEIDARRDELMQRAVSFGQGLQMTNILKDVWEDLDNGFCWLPGDVFRRAGFELQELSRDASNPGFERALAELIGLTRAHLRDALDYTVLIPRGEVGIRRFCLWSLGMAVMTLRNIDRRRDFRHGREVKISRRTVRATILASNLATRRNGLLRWMFAICSAGLPAPVPYPGANGRER